MPTKLIDLGTDAIQAVHNEIAKGIKPFLQFTKDNVEKTVKHLGTYDFPLSRTQIDKIQQASTRGSGLRLPITAAQARKIQQGGFLPLASLIPGAIALGKIAAPGIVGGLGSFGVGKLMKKIFGSGMQPIQLGDGLMLAPYTSGSGMGHDGCTMCFRNADGSTMLPISGGFLKNLLGSVVNMLPF